VIGLFFRLLTLAVLRTVAATVAAFFVLLLVVFLALASAPGTAWLLAVVAEATDDAIVVEGAEGSLLAGLRAERVQVRLDTVAVDGVGVRVVAFWPDLLRARLTLAEASADELLIVLPVAEDASEEPLPESIRLPIGLKVQDMLVGSLRIQRGELDVSLLDSTLSASWFGDRLRIEALETTTEGVRLTAVGEARLGMPFPVDFTLDWSAPELQLSGSGEVSGDLNALRISQQLALPDPVSVSAELRDLAGEPAFEVLAEWAAVSRELPEIGELLSQAGRLSLSGDLQSWVLQLATELTVDEYPPVTVVLLADGDLEQARIADLRLAGGGAFAELSGLLWLGEAPGGELSFRLRDLDPQLFDDRISGRINAAGAVTFSADGDFQAELAEVSGRLLDQPLDASLSLRRRGELYEFDDARLRAGPNELRFSGSWGEQLAAVLELDAPALDGLWPGLAGAARGSGQLGGTPASPQLELELEGSGLAFGAQQAEGLRLRAQLTDGGRIRVELLTVGVASGELALGNFSALAVGTLADHRLAFALQEGPLDFRLDSRGSIDPETRRISQRLVDGSVVDPLGQRWQLADNPEFLLADDRLALEAHCWRSGAAEICTGDLAVEPELVVASASIRELPVALLAALLAPEDIIITGTIDADMSLRQEAGALSATLSWRQQETSLSYEIAADETITAMIPQVLMDLDLAGDELRFALVAASEVGLRLTAGGRVAGVTGDAPQIDAAVIGEIPDLAQLAPLIVRFVDIGDLGGQASLDLQLSGNLFQPLIDGGLSLREGSLSVPETGIVVAPVELDIVGRGPGQLGLSGSARSGAGELALEGDFAWSAAAPPSGRIGVRGENFQLIRLPDIQVDISPDIEVRLITGQFRLNGRVLVPFGEIRLREVAADVPSPSPDVVIHGVDEAPGESLAPLFLVERLEVELGQRVRLSGFGLDTRLAGRLALGQSVRNGQVTLGADGIVTLEQGSFTALGKRLNIDRGALIFSGLIDNPGLDVRTSREVSYQGREVTVGLLLSGTIRSIETRIFSEPAMSEADALSYLVLDRPLSAAGAGEGGALSGAAITLGLRQALPVAQRVGSALSLDEVGLEGGGDIEETELIAGKQLGSDLYVRYAYGLFNRIGTIKLVYRLSRRFSVEASSGENQSLDLIYSVEW